MAPNGLVANGLDTHTNYIAYKDPKALGQSRIGSLDLEPSAIQPLAYISGAPISTLYMYEVMEIGNKQIQPLSKKISPQGCSASVTNL